MRSLFKNFFVFVCIPLLFSVCILYICVCSLVLLFFQQVFVCQLLSVNQYFSSMAVIFNYVNKILVLEVFLFLSNLIFMKQVKSINCHYLCIYRLQNLNPRTKFGQAPFLQSLSQIHVNRTASNFRSRGQRMVYWKKWPCSASTQQKNCPQAVGSAKIPWPSRLQSVDGKTITGLLMVSANKMLQHFSGIDLYSFSLVFRDTERPVQLCFKQGIHHHFPHLSEFFGISPLSQQWL